MPYFRDDIFLKKVGKHIRKLRTEKSITQEELAYDADLDISQVGRIERGAVNTSICVLQRLAKALNIEMKELFDI